jgi:DNA repair protein RecO (recombination protein O)
MKTTEFLSCWLLHSRPYRDSSLLLDFFTEPQGRVSAIARGVRTAKTGAASGRRSLLQPFTPLQIALTGRGELRVLGQVEARGVGLALRGEHLLSALYVNELLVRLLPAHEQEAALFSEYGKLLSYLRQGTDIEPLLRNFELLLLDSLGYGLQLSHEVHSGDPITASHYYALHPDGGFVVQIPRSAQEALYAGGDLLNIASRDFSSVDTRKAAKHLLRYVLQQHLGSRPLMSRSLFGKPGNNNAKPGSRSDKLPPSTTPG